MNLWFASPDQAKCALLELKDGVEVWALRMWFWEFTGGELNKSDSNICFLFLGDGQACKDIRKPGQSYTILAKY